MQQPPPRFHPIGPWFPTAATTTIAHAKVAVERNHEPAVDVRLAVHCEADDPRDGLPCAVMHCADLDGGELRQLAEPKSWQKLHVRVGTATPAPSRFTT